MTNLQRADGLHGLGEMFGDGERELTALDPAWGKAAFFFRTGHRLGHGPDSMRCMSLDEVYRMLNVFRERFEGGDTLSILQAIGMCAEENLPMRATLRIDERHQALRPAHRRCRWLRGFA